MTTGLVAELAGGLVAEVAVGLVAEAAVGLVAELAVGLVAEAAVGLVAEAAVGLVGEPAGAGPAGRIGSSSRDPARASSRRTTARLCSAPLVMIMIVSSPAMVPRMSGSLAWSSAEAR
jgi:hypothetical protein